MRKEATIEQWDELYKVTMNIKRLEPWNYLWDMDIITILLPEYEEPFYCSVMGRGGECFAIAVYKGYDGINGFYKLAEAKEITYEQFMRCQDNLTCYFGDRKEVSKGELKTIKDLGLKFRGKSQWIYFRSFKPGYAPYTLCQDEVIELTYVFKNLFMSLRAIIEKNLKVDFENGNTLYRVYDETQDLWLNFEGPVRIPDTRRITPVINDDILIEKIKRNKYLNGVFEFDPVCLSSVINDKEYERPILTRLIVFAEKNTGIVMNQDMMLPEIDDIEQILNNFVNVLINIGRAKTLYVRDEYISDILSDLCSRVNIELRVSQKLPSIDKFVDSINGGMF